MGQKKVVLQTGALGIIIINILIPYPVYIKHAILWSQICVNLS